MSRRESGDDGWGYLLSLHRQKIRYDDDHWVTIRVTRIPPSKGRPDGVRYAFTLHDRYDERILGYDNSRAVKTATGPAMKSKIAERFDHIDRKGKNSIPYVFTTPYDLVADFFAHVERILAEEA